MLRVPHEIRFADRKLAKHEWLEIEQHPIHTANALEALQCVNQHSLLAAYQTHERCDGSGYPRRRKSMAIHPLGHIVSVADTYAAMTCQRPHRRYSHHPYHAMETILLERKTLDRNIARAFLDCMSLFPVGSDVRLSDGGRARVIRSNGSLHTRPVVVPLDTDGCAGDVEIDLALDDTLKIIGIVEPESPAAAA